MSLPMAAWKAQYAPGDWLVLAGPKMLVAMTPPPERYSAQLEQLWFAMLQAPSVDALVALVADLGLDQVPALGALFWDDAGLHGLTRGGVRLVDADGTTALEGAGTLTWREEPLGRERRLRLDLGAPAGSQARLPLAVGVVYASEVHLSTAAQDQLRLADPAPAAPVPAEPGLPVASPSSPLPEPQPWSSPGPQVFVDEAVAQRISSPQEVIADPDPSYDTILEDQSWQAEPVAEPARHSEEFSLDADTESGELSPPPSPVPVPSATPAPVVGAPPVPGLPAAQPPVAVPSESPAGEYPPAEEAPAEPQVLAVPCINGHANAPGARGCRLCNSPIASTPPRLIRRPVLAGVHTNKGDFAEIREGVIVGRAPAPGSGPAGAHLMRVISPSNDISRNHVLITAKDWDVFVTDLHSTNGTTVIPIDGPPFTIRDGMTVVVSINTVLDLGDGVSLRIEQPRG